MIEQARALSNKHTSQSMNQYTNRNLIIIEVIFVLNMSVILYQFNIIFTLFSLVHRTLSIIIQFSSVTWSKIHCLDGWGWNLLAYLISRNRANASIQYKRAYELIIRWILTQYVRIYEWLHSMHFVYNNSYTHTNTYIHILHTYICLNHRHSGHFVLQDIWADLHAGILSLFSVNFLCLLVYLLVLFSFCSFSISTAFQCSTCNVSTPCMEERTNIVSHLCLLQFNKNILDWKGSRIMEM